MKFSGVSAGAAKQGPMLGIFDKPWRGLVFDRPFCNIGDCLLNMKEADVLAMVSGSDSKFAPFGSSNTKNGNTAGLYACFSGEILRSGRSRGGLFVLGDLTMTYISEHDLSVSNSCLAKGMQLHVDIKVRL
jgi:hypothetical protein